MRTAALAVVVSLALCTSACRSDEEVVRHGGHDAHRAAAAHAAAESEHRAWAEIREAVCAVHPTGNHRCRGWVRFADAGDGVRITAEISGLTPNAQHAFHVHEWGDCTSADGKSAGEHYNPGGHPHGGPDAPMRHAGDFGNLQADGNGVARYDRVVTGISVAGRHAVLGRAVIVHAKADDLTSQPTGNAGDRIGCGVIGVAKPAR